MGFLCSRRCQGCSIYLHALRGAEPFESLGGLRGFLRLEQGEVGLEACQRRLRGIGSSQRLAQLEDIDKAKASEIGKTATGRLPCSLLEVYVHLQADMQQELLPDAEWLHMDIFTGED